MYTLKIWTRLTSVYICEVVYSVLTDQDKIGNWKPSVVVLCVEWGFISRSQLLVCCFWQLWQHWDDRLLLSSEQYNSNLQQGFGKRSLAEVPERLTNVYSTFEKKKKYICFATVHCLLKLRMFGSWDPRCCYFPSLAPCHLWRKIVDFPLVTIFTRPKFSHFCQWDDSRERGQCAACLSADMSVSPSLAVCGSTLEWQTVEVVRMISKWVNIYFIPLFSLEPSLLVTPKCIVIVVSIMSSMNECDQRRV